MSQYQYRLLRYVSNPIGGEFYNIAVVLYDQAGRVVDARFTPDFRRMRCNPAVEITEIEKIRDEFQDRALLGEDFTGYLRALTKEGSNSIELSDPTVIVWDDPTKEIDRMVDVYLATTVGLEGHEPQAPLQGRALVRLRVDESFQRHGLFLNGHGMQRSVRVDYDRFGHSFEFDFHYEPPSKEQRFIHAMPLRKPEELAERLCFVLGRYRERSREEVGLAVVAENSLGDDVRQLLAGEGIGTVNLSAIDGYAASIRRELGL